VVGVAVGVAAISPPLPTIMSAPATPMSSAQITPSPIEMLRQILSSTRFLPVSAIDRPTMDGPKITPRGRGVGISGGRSGKSGRFG
jgi:hypothetical protein